MKIVSGDYVVGLRSADGEEIGHRCIPCRRTDRRAVQATTADGELTPVTVFPVNEQDDRGVIAMTEDGERTPVRFYPKIMSVVMLSKARWYYDHASAFVFALEAYNALADKGTLVSLIVQPDWNPPQGPIFDQSWLLPLGYSWPPQFHYGYSPSASVPLGSMQNMFLTALGSMVPDAIIFRWYGGPSIPGNPYGSPEPGLSMFRNWLYGAYPYTIQHQSRPPGEEAWLEPINNAINDLQLVD